MNQYGWLMDASNKHEWRSISASKQQQQQHSSPINGMAVSSPHSARRRCLVRRRGAAAQKALDIILRKLSPHLHGRLISPRPNLAAPGCSPAEVTPDATPHRLPDVMPSSNVVSLSCWLIIPVLLSSERARQLSRSWSVVIAPSGWGGGLS